MTKKSSKDENITKKDDKMKEAKEAKESKENESNVSEDQAAEQAEIVSEEERLAEAEKKAAEYKDALLRVQAEFDNYRKRTAENRIMSRNDGICDVIMELLPAVDNLERGLELVKDESAKNGMELILKQLKEILNKFNVCEISSLGEEFNPDKHHAIAKEENEDEEKDNKITEVYVKGYERKSKVLRPAMVKVSNK